MDNSKIEEKTELEEGPFEKKNENNENVSVNKNVGLKGKRKYIVGTFVLLFAVVGVLYLKVYNKSSLNVPEAVDLGLSVKWASCNFGANNPWDYGNYYKWGETKPADDKGKETYKYFRNDIFDVKKVLKPSYDAATVNLGDKWRMPTEKEIEELVNKCKIEETTINSVKGIKVIGPNGNTIFLPSSGYLDYDSGSVVFRGTLGSWWSATYYNKDECYSLDYMGRDLGPAVNSRAIGLTIRPVLAE